MTDLFRLDGFGVDVGREWTLTPTTLSLTIRADSDDIEQLRRYRLAGDLEVDDGFAGRFRAQWTGDGDGRVTVTPPDWLSPPLVERDWLVQGYAESQHGIDAYHVELEMQAITNRAPAFDPHEGTEGDLTLDLARGRLDLPHDRVGQTDREGVAAGETLTLPLRLRPPEAAELADTLAYPGGVVEDQVIDGEDALLDESGQQTVTVDHGATLREHTVLPRGEYLAREWELTQRTVPTAPPTQLHVDAGETYTLEADEDLEASASSIGVGGELVQEAGSTLETIGHPDDAAWYVAEVQLTAVDIETWLVVSDGQTHTVEGSDVETYNYTTIRSGGELVQEAGSTLETTGPQNA